MRDPHVERLRYKLKEADTIRFDAPPPLDLETDACRLHLEDGVLTAEMKEHHPSEASARSRVDPFLRSWELDVSLRWGRGAIRFEFEGAEIIDRDPPPPGEGGVVGAAGVSLGSTWAVGSPRVISGHKTYPSPPARFATSPDVETMWFRYEMYLDGKEPLLSMAFACLTLLETSTGMTGGFREAVCRTYNIDRAVRDKLGDIVSERGGRDEARKLGSRATMTPLTEAEKGWVEAVIKAFIRRKAEYDADPASASALPQITMSDFPPP